MRTQTEANERGFGIVDDISNSENSKFLNLGFLVEFAQIPILFSGPWITS
jgi:hypothetical protein